MSYAFLSKLYKIYRVVNILVDKNEKHKYKQVRLKEATQFYLGDKSLIKVIFVDIYDIIIQCKSYYCIINTRKSTHLTNLSNFAALIYVV